MPLTPISTKIDLIKNDVTNAVVTLAKNLRDFESQMLSEMSKLRAEFNEVRSTSRVDQIKSMLSEWETSKKILKENNARLEKTLKLVRNGEDGRNGFDGLNGKDADPQETADIVIKALSSQFEGIKKLENMVELLQDELDSVKESKGKTIYVGSTGDLSPYHSPFHESFTMNGSDTFVTLQAGVGAVGNAIIVRYQGQTLDMTTHYTVSGNRVTFVGFVPEADSIISITYWR